MGVNVYQLVRARVRKALPRVMENCTLFKEINKSEAIICYTGLTLKQGISGKL